MNPKLWLAAIGAFAAVDFLADRSRRDGDPRPRTLCDAGRIYLHTDTRAGRFVTSVLIAGGALWLQDHLTNDPYREAVDAGIAELEHWVNRGRR